MVSALHCLDILLNSMCFEVLCPVTLVSIAGNINTFDTYVNTKKSSATVE